MFEISVKLKNEYPVYVSDGTQDFCGKVLPKIKGKKVAVITDTTVDKLYGEKFCELLKNYEITKIVLPVGEKEKNAENFIKTVNILAENSFTKDDTVIAFGGGVIGDLAGFCASTYMRGITLISVPTTILSCVDSSIGGKTAINLEKGKNLVGSFYQPTVVYENTEYLKTLPNREVLSGFGEIIKYAFIDKNVDISKNIEEIIKDCVSVKKRIVEIDEKDEGIRKILNLGHSVGHVLEKAYNYEVSHGECVIKGLFVAVCISKEYFNLPEKFYFDSVKLLTQKGHNLKVERTAREIISLMKSDKKSHGESIDFVMLKNIGEPVVVNVSFKLLEKYMEDTQKLWM